MTGNGWGPPRELLLQPAWVLRGVDVEKIARSVLVESLRGNRMRLEDDDFRQALSQLFESAFVLDARYCEAPGREFGPYLYAGLRLRLIDYWRSWYGRDGRHRMPVPDPEADLDDSWVVDADDPTGGSRADRLAEARERSTGGPESRIDDLRWVIAEGDRRHLREAGRMGVGTCLRIEAQDPEAIRNLLNVLTDDLELVAA